MAQNHSRFVERSWSPMWWWCLEIELNYSGSSKHLFIPTNSHRTCLLRLFCRTEFIGIPCLVGRRYCYHLDACFSLFSSISHRSPIGIFVICLCVQCSRKSPCIRIDCDSKSAWTISASNLTCNRRQTMSPFRWLLLWLPLFICACKPFRWPPVGREKIAPLNDIQPRPEWV